LFAALDQVVQTLLASRLATIQLYEVLGDDWMESPEDWTQVVEVAAQRQF
jgi:hypothetical protein